MSIQHCAGLLYLALIFTLLVVDTRKISMKYLDQSFRTGYRMGLYDGFIETPNKQFIVGDELEEFEMLISDYYSEDDNYEA